MLQPLGAPSDENGNRSGAEGSRVGCAELAVESGLKGTHREPLLIQLLEVVRLHI